MVLTSSYQDHPGCDQERTASRRPVVDGVSVSGYEGLLQYPGATVRVSHVIEIDGPFYRRVSEPGESDMHSDRWIRHTTTASILLVADAAVVSSRHMHKLTLVHGEDPLAAALILRERSEPESPEAVLPAP